MTGAPVAPTDDQRARFAAALDRLAPQGRIGVAVSGGPDSLALLLLGHAVRPDRIVAATVDHGLRSESKDEAAEVAALCARLGVPHAILTVTVEDAGEGLQAAARTARYAALRDWADAQDARFVATAHHADDQAETLLMRLARGAGAGGLAGVRPARPLGPDVTLIRPLLDWRKAELEAVAAAAGLMPVQDPSNADPRFDRTRARRLLAEGWPDPVRVAASARHLAQAEEALAWTAVKLARERMREDAGALRIDAAGLPPELGRRLLLAAFGSLGEPTPRGDSLDRLHAALRGGETATLGGLKCEGGQTWRITRAPPHRSP